MQRKMTAALLAVLMAAVWVLTALAAQGDDKNVWVEKKGYYFYKGEDGALVTGLNEIDGKKCLFDDNGFQLHGWRKVDDKFYHFRYANEAEGYADADTTINGIRIDENGEAIVDSDAVRAKAETMACYSEWADEFIRPSMTWRQKLYACLFELRKFPYRAEGEDVLSIDNWDVICARELYLRKDKERYANCYRFAAGFAYMANAIGYENIKTCAMWGHGWTMINGNIFDIPHTIRLGNDYFPVPKDKHDNFPAAYIRDIQLM